MAHDQNLEKNLPLLCAFHALTMCIFPIAVFSVFLRDEIQLNVATIMTLQAVFAVVVALLEFPSGYLADRLGYKKTLIVGATIAAAGWLAYTLADTLLEVALSEVLLGVGFALVSGADLALLSETLVKLGRTEETTRWISRRQLWAQVAEATSALCAGFLYATWSRLPLAADVIVFLGAALLCFRLVHIAGSEELVTDHRAKVREILGAVTHERPELRRVILAMIGLSLATYVPIWLIPLYATGAGLPVAWLGPFWAVASVLVGVAALYTERLLGLFGRRGVLVFVLGLILTAYLGLGVSHSLLGVAFYLCLPVARGLFSPILMAEEQRLIPSGDRASFVSFRSFLFRGSFVLLGPLVGYSVDRFGQHPTLLVVGGALGLLCIAAVVALEGGLEKRTLFRFGMRAQRTRVISPRGS